MSAVRVVMLTGLHRRLSTSVLPNDRHRGVPGQTGTAVALSIRWSMCSLRTLPTEQRNGGARSTQRSGLAFNGDQRLRVLIAEDTPSISGCGASVKETWILR